EGLMPELSYPRIPGHEVIGVIDALGPNVEGWDVGARAGVGWFGGSCGYCGHCRRGDAFACENIHGATGVTRDGGYATHMLALASALAHVPKALDSVESAPLLCAGITTFNALRNCGAQPGDLVAIHGVGGLGHLGIQFAARSGFRTVAINRGRVLPQGEMFPNACLLPHHKCSRPTRVQPYTLSAFPPKQAARDARFPLRR